jgi:hypothetical protein
MTFEPDDMIQRNPIGLRRYAPGIDLPIDQRLRTRLGRALIYGLTNPVRGVPTTRRVVLIVRRALNAQGYSDDAVRLELERLMEEVALRHGLDTTSVLSGRSRRHELMARISDWIAGANDTVP